MSRDEQESRPLPTINSTIKDFEPVLEMLWAKNERLKQERDRFLTERNEFESQTILLYAERDDCKAKYEQFITAAYCYVPAMPRCPICEAKDVPDGLCKPCEYRKQVEARYEQRDREARKLLSEQATIAKLLAIVRSERDSLAKQLEESKGASVALRSALAAALRVNTDSQKQLEEARKALFLTHSCYGKYGDDGEMQCSACMIDFKRDSIEHILGRLQHLALAALAKLEAR